MRFELSEGLLTQLRRAREVRREEAAAREGASVSRSGAAPSASLGSSSSWGAEQFVAGMDELRVDVESRFGEAFLLDPGMGPMTYLTSDGRVLLDLRSWDGEGVREATDDEASVALVVGARKTGVTELLDLIPAAPAEARSCVRCNGARMEVIADAAFVCGECMGRGWVESASPAEP